MPVFPDEIRLPEGGATPIQRAAGASNGGDTTWRVSRARGLTLVELLTVVAIVSLLVGVLIPAVGWSRARARDAGCLANLSHVGRAIHAFSNSNDDAPAAAVRDRDYFWDREPRLGWDIMTGAAVGVPGGADSVWRCPSGETAYVGNVRALGMDNRQAIDDGLLHRVPRTRWHSPSRLVIAYDFQTNFVIPFPHATDPQGGDVSDERWEPWPRGEESPVVPLYKAKYGPHRTRYGAVFADGHAEVDRFEKHRAVLWSGPKWWSDTVRKSRSPSLDARSAQR
ncbi:MAG: prepilin-type N-terminal cleavage/methylation domain-containing protein [Phycisphaerae bacterium]|nr:MAG: prepilin-type N-terminal cleavage/methylation domain-containing protein [Planctomycetota bacterium]MBE7456903.1 prepilin-type N-terminal cleavage/methylation domain-containing protein [Planctomycetia bacterium]MCL4717943.1 prepilin-type N-terminal cleavage/methylation domain-containing protein [Phycisphaerae bacterium]MCQ3919840.1 hypothetical protein [Planctomycetota bacterium]